MPDLDFEANAYLERYAEHMDRGDDPETARLRIIEEGCPMALAQAIADAFDPESE